MAQRQEEDKNLRDVKAVLHSLQRIGEELPPVAVAGKNLNPADTLLKSLLNRKDASRLPSGTGKKRASLEADQGLGDVEASAQKKPVQGQRLGALALAMIAAGTVILLGSDLFFQYWPASLSSKQATSIKNGASLLASTAELTGAKISVPIDSSQEAKGADAIDGNAASLVNATPVFSPNSPIGNARQLMEGGHILAAREMLLQADLAASQDGAWLLARSYDPNYLATIKSRDGSADKGQAEVWYRRWRDIGTRSGMVMDDTRLERLIQTIR